MIEETTGEVEKVVETESVKCQNCGGNMVFDPSTQMLFCAHCGTKCSFNQDLKAEEIALSSYLSMQTTWSEKDAAVFRCDNCGAKIVVSATETATICPFCSTPHVKVIDELVGVKPNTVLPFAFTEQKALEFSKAWAKKRFFAPRSFKKTLKAENLKGVYTPCFTFDSQTTSYYEGRLGETRTRTVGSGKNRRVETYTVWFHVRGTYDCFFDDVLITAGNKFSQRELDGVSPYNTNEGKAYEEEFLLGYMAYHYDKELTDCWTSAKSKIDSKIKRGILSKYCYDKVDYLNVSTTHSNVTFKYVMLPVYVGNFNYKQKLFNFYVNGCTGKVFGKTPKSPLKIALMVLLGLVIIAGVALIVHLTS